MKRVPISQFTAHCSLYVEQVSNEDLVITTDGKGVARLLPPTTHHPRQHLGSFWDS